MSIYTYRGNENIFPVFSNLDVVFSLLYRDFIVNEGKNLTMPCGDENPSIWRRDDRNISNNYNVIIVSVKRLSPSR